MLLILNGGSALVYTTTPDTTWTADLDSIMKEDPSETCIRLKWKPSQGGRAFASPSAIGAALTANKRIGKNGVCQLDYATSVTLLGEIGKEDGLVLYQLMEYVVANALVDGGLKDLRRAANPDKPKLGEFLHLASVDPSAPPGKLQVFCASESDVEDLRRLLHEKTLKCGSDYVGITVSNDVLAARAVPTKNGGRRRK